MASLRTASTSCLGCVARRSPLAAASARPTLLGLASTQLYSASSPSPATTQTRGKKTNRRREQGVVVRLLEDVTQYGRRDTVLRVERGRMRNFWYPNGMAEYMTSARLAALGVPDLTDVIAKPDPWFVAAQDGVVAEAAAGAGRQTMTLRSISAPRAAALLETLLPSTLIFYRKPIAADNAAIFGSVSADDVAAMLREVLQASGEEDALLVRVEPRDVRFVVADATATPAAQEAADGEQSSTVDRIKALGRWEVDIAVRGSHSSGGSAEARSVEPVRKTVEVVATQE